MEWLVFLNEKDPVLWHREDQYLAQIGAEVRRGNVKHPERVTTADFLIKNQVVRQPLTPEERMNRSKSFWDAVLSPKKRK